MIGGSNPAGWSSSTPISTCGRSSRYSITLRPLRPGPAQSIPAWTWSSRVFHTWGNSAQVVATGITAVGRLGTVTIEIVLDTATSNAVEGEGGVRATGARRV